MATPELAAAPLARPLVDHLLLAGGLLGALAVLGATFFAPAPFTGPVGLLIIALAGVAGAALLSSPMAALLVLVVASFTRLAVTGSGLQPEPAVLCFAVLVVAVLIAAGRGLLPLRFGPLELAMLAYLGWNV